VGFGNVSGPLGVASGAEALGEPLKAARRVSEAGGFLVLPPNPVLGKVPSPPTVDTVKAYSLPDLIDLRNRAVRRRESPGAMRGTAVAAGIAESAFLPNITASAIGGYQGSSDHQTTLGASSSDNSSLDRTVSALPRNSSSRLWGADRRCGCGEARIGDLEHRLHRRASAAHLQRHSRFLQSRPCASPPRHRDAIPETRTMHRAQGRRLRRTSSEAHRA
jgi:hypothetical protein